MRDYSCIDSYLDKLEEDIYPSPVDDAHKAWALDALIRLRGSIVVSSVLDVGCGEGYCQDIFSSYGIHYSGITLGSQDFDIATTKDRNVSYGDMSFVSRQDNQFDMVFARHVLEHSPFPILTLMEWIRIARRYIMIIVPAPDYWGYHGQNHYYVLNDKQWWNLFDKLGLNIIKEHIFKTSDLLFMKYYLPEEEDRSKVVFPGPPRIVEYRWLLEIKDK